MQISQDMNKYATFALKGMEVSKLQNAAGQCESVFVFSRAIVEKVASY